MNFNQHMIVGLATVGSVLYLLRNVIHLSLIEYLTLPFIIIIGTNLADIDHHLGKLRKYLFIFIFTILACISGVYLLYGLEATILTVTIIGLLGLCVYQAKHRGLFHSYLISPFLLLPLVFVGFWGYIIGILAYWVHILSDTIYSTVKRAMK